MARIVLGSNVVIYISQDKLELKNLPSIYDEILISSITCMDDFQNIDDTVKLFNLPIDQ